ncbi:MAG TPA: hypothetical protein VF933_21500, partial [Streptosporangiaceae bacterium]
FIGAMVSLLRGRQFIYDDAPAGGGLARARAASAPVPLAVKTTINGTNGTAPAPRPRPGHLSPGAGHRQRDLPGLSERPG